MADKKISALTGATTPLVGTEVLPIVQSGSTVKVSVANLTLGRDVSMDNATVNGHVNVLAGDVRFDDERFVYSYAGGTVGQYMSGTYYDGSGGTQRIFLNNAEVARWTGGNLQVSTAAKGVNFTANTPAAGKTSQLLNNYEEGTWTPTDASGAGLSLTIGSATYTRIGRQVTCLTWITYPANASGLALTLGGIPFPCASTNTLMGVSCYNSAGFQLFARASSTSTLIFVKNDNTDVLNSFESGKLFAVQFTYFV